jgi:hypothetical protein
LAPQDTWHLKIRRVPSSTVNFVFSLSARTPQAMSSAEEEKGEGEGGGDIIDITDDPSPPPTPALPKPRPKPGGSSVQSKITDLFSVPATAGRPKGRKKARRRRPAKEQNGPADGAEKKAEGGEALSPGLAMVPFAKKSPSTRGAGIKAKQGVTRTDWAIGEAKVRFDKAVEDWLHHGGD